MEKLICKQITSSINKLISKYQCGFRNGFNAQECLLNRLEKWKRTVDNEKVFGALLTDLSIAFDCILRDSIQLIIANLDGYGFTLPSLKLISHYLTNWKQRIKINQSFSSWEDKIFGVPQESILGPILFNIFIADQFLVIDNIDFARR